MAQFREVKIILDKKGEKEEVNDEKSSLPSREDPHNQNRNLSRRNLIFNLRIFASNKANQHILLLQLLVGVSKTQALVPEVEVVAPPKVEPLPHINTDGFTPLPLSLTFIPVGGRLAHFAQRWANTTDNKLILSCINKGYRIPFTERPILSQTVFF